MIAVFVWIVMGTGGFVDCVVHTELWELVGHHLVVLVVVHHRLLIHDWVGVFSVCHWSSVWVDLSVTDICNIKIEQLSHYITI